MNQEVSQIEMYRAICWQSCQSAKGAQTKAKVFLEVKSLLTGVGRGGVAMSDTHVFLLFSDKARIVYTIVYHLYNEKG